MNKQQNRLGAVAAIAEKNAMAVEVKILPQLEPVGGICA
jgi:hypothetical protein